MWTKLHLALLVAFSSEAAALAQGTTIWNGPTITFTEPPGANGTQPSDQDRLTDNVWLTRGFSRGLFNAKTESFYNRFSSPVGTEWAYGNLPDYASLSFTSWADMSGRNPPLMVGRDAVLHLIADDIYLSVRFLSWGGVGTGFSYDRSTPLVPEPSAVSICMVGLVVAGIMKVRLKRSRTRSFICPNQTAANP